MSLHRKTALEEALEKGDIECIRLFNEYFEQRNIKMDYSRLTDSRGNTALHLCSINMVSMDIFKAIRANYSGDINQRNKEGRTPLLSAVCGVGEDVELARRHEAVVAALLQEPGIDVNAQDEHGDTAWIIAARNGSSADLRLLLADKRIDIEVKNKNGKTALEEAVQSKSREGVRFLLAHYEKQKSTNEPDSVGDVPFLAQNFEQLLQIERGSVETIDLKRRIFTALNCDPTEIANLLKTQDPASTVESELILQIKPDYQLFDALLLASAYEGGKGRYELTEYGYSVESHFDIEHELELYRHLIDITDKDDTTKLIFIIKYYTGRIDQLCKELGNGEGSDAFELNRHEKMKAWIAQFIGPEMKVAFQKIIHTLPAACVHYSQDFDRAIKDATQKLAVEVEEQESTLQITELEPVDQAPVEQPVAHPAPDDSHIKQQRMKHQLLITRLFVDVEDVEVSQAMVAFSKMEV